MEEKYGLNDSHIHEAIDRLHVSICYLESFITEHPLIHSVDEFREEVEKAADILAALYQKVGGYDEVSTIEKEYGIGEGYEISK